MNTETTSSVLQDVDANFAKHCRVADTNEFLEKLLPVPDSIIQIVLQKLTGSHYDGERWKDFPSGEAAGKKKALYAPFIKVANAIRTAIEEAEGAANNDLRGVATWVNYHSQIPDSSNSDAAIPVRPDCLLAHNVSKFAPPTNDRLEPEDQSKQPDEKDKETQRKEALQASNWWLQIICARWISLTELIGHLRRILSEQLDRRFVLGLTLGPNRMTVWLHDRSGVLGTSESFDIHQDPHSFIRVIGAFSVLHVEQLGFDTQMKFYASPNNIVPTYMLNHEAALVYLAATSREKQWVITTNGNEHYLTVKVLSISRACIMQSSASLVWAVVPFKDGKVTSKKILVLKQCWRPVGSNSEREMLIKVKNAAADMMDTSGEDFIGHVQLEETISMEGKEDITGSLIRKGLEVTVSTSTNPKRTCGADIERYLQVNVTDDDIISIVPFAASSSPPISRVHTRLLLSTFGWPLKYFKTRREAVRGIRDAVGGHGYIYFNGLLHRDISPGNIVLAWCDGEDGTTGLGTKGCLIDFDRGKYGKTNESVLDVPANFTAMASNDDLIPLFARDVIINASKATSFDGLIGYVRAAWNHVSRFSTASIGPVVDSTLLRWTMVSRKFSFKFTDEELQSGSRTGTPPYMSGEILLRERYYSSQSGGSDLFHDAVHDIESFFWVLIHICLTRSGPDAQRRAELDGDSKDHPQLHLVVYCFFGGNQDVLAFNKKKLFRAPDNFEEYIIPHFHPYFDELKSFMREWFSLLVLAYQYVEGYEYHNIHRRVQDILDHALASMTQERDSDAGRKSVIESRYDLLYNLTENSVGTKGLSSEVL
ncbi:hypothetical protein BDZ89DRAFT_1079105 [Hymenopellis radicata]|nr:hypothetical protein BDZ89DRAFT_1079105 [Hymenopellis radicata]